MDASVVGHTHRMKDDRRVKGIEEKQEDVGLVLDKRGGKGGGKVEGMREERERERESPCEYVIRSSSFARNRAVE